MGSGEIPISEDEWEDIDDPVEEIGGTLNQQLLKDSPQKLLAARRRNSLICPIYNEAYKPSSTPHSHLSTMERQTQTEPPKKPKWKQVCDLLKILGIYWNHKIFNCRFGCAFWEMINLGDKDIGKQWVRHFLTTKPLLPQKLRKELWGLIGYSF